MKSTLSTCRMESPLGEILLVADQERDALCGLYLERQKYFPDDTGRWCEAPNLPVLRDAVVQLREYFAGARTRFDIALAPAGTPFQRDVWSAINTVPFGETITYAELARRCGRPSAARAAGGEPLHGTGAIAHPHPGTAARRLLRERDVPRAAGAVRGRRDEAPGREGLRAELIFDEAFRRQMQQRDAIHMQRAEDDRRALFPPLHPAKRPLRANAIGRQVRPVL